MRIRTTLFAVTLATAALLGGAGTAAADNDPGFADPGSGFGADFSSAPMGGAVPGTGRDAAGGSDGSGSAGREMTDESPGGLFGRLMGM